MFNDERINLEMTKLKKFITILSLVLSFMFLLFKLFVNYSREIQFCLYSTEIIISITSIIILIGAFLIKSDIKDELFFQKKQNYYNKSFKILLYISFISYAVVIPATIVSGDNSASFARRSNKINFNDWWKESLWLYLNGYKLFLLLCSSPFCRLNFPLQGLTFYINEI